MGQGPHPPAAPGAPLSVPLGPQSPHKGPREIFVTPRCSQPICGLCHPQDIVPALKPGIQGPDPAHHPPSISPPSRRLFCKQGVHVSFPHHLLTYPPRRAPRVLIWLHGGWLGGEARSETTHKVTASTPLPSQAWRPRDSTTAHFGIWCPGLSLPRTLTSSLPSLPSKSQLSARSGVTRRSPLSLGLLCRLTTTEGGSTVTDGKAEVGSHVSEKRG